MSIKFNFTAEASGVLTELQKIRQSVQELSWADFSMGLQSVLSLAAQAKDAIAGLVTSFTRPAEALENAAARLGVVLNNKTMGDELAESLQRMATNGVVSMQELEQAAVTLSGSFSDSQTIAQWVGVFADISAGSKITATRLAEMTARLDDMGKAELTELANAGIPVYKALAKVLGTTTQEVVKMSASGKIASADLLQALKSLTDEGGKFEGLNAAMSNTTSGSWDTLAASWAEIQAEIGRHFNDIIRPMLQKVAAFLQNFKKEISAILGFGVKFGIVMAGLNVAKLLIGLRAAVASMTTMHALAGKIKLAFAAIGKIGWVALVAGAWELGSWAWDKFSGAADARQAQEKADRERQVRQAIAEAERKQKEEETQIRLESRDAQRAIDELEARFKSAKSIEEFDAALRDLNSYVEQLTDTIERSSESLEINAARGSSLRDAWKLQDKTEGYRQQTEERVKKETAEKNKQELRKLGDSTIGESMRRKHEEHFAQMTSAAQIELLRYALKDIYPLKPNESLDSMERGISMWQHSLIETGYDSPKMRAQIAKLGRLYNRIGVIRDTQKREKEEAKEKKERYDAGMLALKDRQAIIAAKEANDPAAVQRIEDAQAAAAMAKEWIELGMNPLKARGLAADVVARERAIEEKEKGARREFVADSLQTIGGGGRGFSLGEAQMRLSRQHVSIAERSRELLAEINQRLQNNNTIPVTP